MVKACHSDYAIKYDGEGIVDCNTFDNIFVVGGLYGNIEACLELLRLREEYPNSLFIFNGDLHWFDKDYEDFMLVERLTDYGIRLLGNVEGFPLMYNSCAFIERFVKAWPIGSDASKSYLDRIEGKLGNNIDDIVIEIKTK